MTDLHFWGECKKTLERDLPVEEYSTWIAPLTLEQNNGSNPLSYSVLAPNRFISDWVEDNYGITIKERLSAITSMRDFNLNFEIFIDYHDKSPDEMLRSDSNTSEKTTRTAHSAKVPKKNNLISNFTFETFVEGKSNHIALAASRQIGDGLKNSYNPLFIYGGVGLGKTHLMHAVGNEILKQDPNKKIAYVGEQVTVIYKLYAKNNLSIENIDYPKNEGFWSEDLQTTQNAKFRNTQINGVNYRVATLYKVAMFPTTTSKFGYFFLIIFKVFITPLVCP